jgi:predicted ester cyclase
VTGEELSRGRVQIINEKRFDQLSELLSRDVVTHYGMQELHGIDELAGALERYAAFPDIRVSIEALVVDGDEVGVRYMSRGTHSGTFMGIAPTGRTVAFGGASINRIINGKIAETWTVDDLSALMDLDDVRGFTAFRELLESFYVGMPDLQITIEDIVGAGDTLIMRSVSRATHTGELFGIPPSGRKLVYTGVSTYQVVGGKLAVEWFNDDLFTLMQQLTTG